MWMLEKVVPVTVTVIPTVTTAMSSNTFLDKARVLILTVQVRTQKVPIEPVEAF
jgi:hypothetical protein